MNKLLVKLFIKNYKDVNDEKVRSRYGFFSGIVGIISNAILVVIKILIGVLTASISIIADAINNLSDMASSLITIVGFKLSRKEADDDHPFGHERIEYICGLIVSLIVLIIGGNFLITSFKKIFNPSDLSITNVGILLLVISIIIKLWQSTFYKYTGKKISSTVLLASSKDSLNDCLSTSAVLISMLVMKFTQVNIDAYIGCLVSLLVMYNGIKMVLDASSPLIGSLPSKEYVDGLIEIVLSDEKILGFHDLVIHSYGPSKFYGTIHLEFDYKEDIVEIHEIVDTLEKRAFDEIGMELVVHMDPIDNSDDVKELKTKILSICKEVDGEISIHDFRIVNGVNMTKILFDCVLPIDLKPMKNTIKEKIEAKISELDSKYECIIAFDTRYLYK